MEFISLSLSPKKSRRGSVHSQRARAASELGGLSSAATAGESRPRLSLSLSLFLSPDAHTSSLYAALSEAHGFAHADGLDLGSGGSAFSLERPLQPMDSALARGLLAGLQHSALLEREAGGRDGVGVGVSGGGGGGGGGGGVGGGGAGGSSGSRLSVAAAVAEASRLALMAEAQALPLSGILGGAVGAMPSPALAGRAQVGAGKRLRGSSLRFAIGSGSFDEGSLFGVVAAVTAASALAAAGDGGNGGDESGRGATGSAGAITGMGGRDDSVGAAHAHEHARVRLYSDFDSLVMAAPQSSGLGNFSGASGGGGGDGGGGGGGGGGGCGGGGGSGDAGGERRLGRTAALGVVAISAARAVSTADADVGSWGNESDGGGLLPATASARRSPAGGSAGSAASFAGAAPGEAEAAAASATAAQGGQGDAPESDRAKAQEGALDGNNSSGGDSASRSESGSGDEWDEGGSEAASASAAAAGAADAAAASAGAAAAAAAAVAPSKAMASGTARRPGAADARRFHVSPPAALLPPQAHRGQPAPLASALAAPAVPSTAAASPPPLPASVSALAQAAHQNQLRAAAHSQAQAHVLTRANASTHVQQVLMRSSHSSPAGAVVLASDAAASSRPGGGVWSSSGPFAAFGESGGGGERAAPRAAAAAVGAATAAGCDGDAYAYAARLPAGAAGAGDASDSPASDRALLPALRRLLQSAPRLVEGSLVPQVRETSVRDGITLPFVPAIDGWVGAYPFEARTRRLALYQMKRGLRVWEKTVKYDVRKSFADSRLRVKGRFVKKEDEALLRDFCQLL